MKPCLLIPIFDHGSTIVRVVEELLGLQLPCLIIDDGSHAATRAELEKLAGSHDWVRVETRNSNRGKGAALKTGYRLAASLGFSHALQLDADGQHSVADLPKLLGAARTDPEALVLASPRFESAPRSRLIGRRISRLWVWIETLSFAIGDPLCGLRCMPLAATLRVMDRHDCGDRMDFDPEIAVRLVWSGVPVVNVPCRVRYHADAVSHFRLLEDNFRISWLHTRLFFGMMLRAPSLLLRRLGSRR